VYHGHDNAVESLLPMVQAKRSVVYICVCVEVKKARQAARMLGKKTKPKKSRKSRHQVCGEGMAFLVSWGLGGAENENMVLACRMFSSLAASEAN
jgi:hypothetical protein